MEIYRMFIRRENEMNGGECEFTSMSYLGLIPTRKIFQFLPQYIVELFYLILEFYFFFDDCTLWKVFFTFISILGIRIIKQIQISKGNVYLKCICDIYKKNFTYTKDIPALTKHTFLTAVVK